MKKLFPYFGGIMISAFGWLLHCSPVLSCTAAWSRIVGSVNLCAWELFKPFAIAYIFWILIELSWLRPRLMHFVCAKLTGMLVLCISVLALSMLLCSYMHYPMIRLVIAAAAISSAQLVSYLLYSSSFPVEALRVPLILSLGCMVFMLLFLSFYPPHWGIFFDFHNGGYGHTIKDSTVSAALSCSETAGHFLHII